MFLFLALTLLVLGVVAYHTQNAAPLDDAALIAHALD